jgi:hypothetical protein
MSKKVVNKGELIAIRKALTKKKLFKKDEASGRLRVMIINIYILV